MTCTGHLTDRLVGHHLVGRYHPSQDHRTGTDRLVDRPHLSLGGYRSNHQGHHHLDPGLLTRNKGVMLAKDVMHYDIQITYGVVLLPMM